MSIISLYFAVRQIQGEMDMNFTKSKARDMTTGTPMRLILAFALPLFLGDLFQMCYNLADAAIVGRVLGTEALAAVGAAAPGYSLFTMVISGFANGASVVVAQAFGSGDEEYLRKAYSTSILVLMLSGIVVTVFSLFLVRPILLLLHTPENVLEASRLYLQWMCLGVLATCLYNGMASILRAVGDSATPLIALILASILNIILDLVFVMGFGLGVSGAAIATILSQLLSGCLCVYFVYRNIPPFRLRFREYRIYGSILREVIRVGFPAALSMAVVIFSVMLIQRAVNAYGSTVVAAFTAASRAENVYLCLSFSMGMATGIFTAQNAGAKKIDRVLAGLRTGIRITLIYHVLMGIVIFVMAPYLIRLFTASAEVISISTEIVRISACFAPVLGVLFVFQNFLRNVSDVSPTILMSTAEIVCRGFLPFQLSGRFGYHGIWWATPVGWSLSLLIGIVRYRSGRWKTVMQRHSEQT